MQTCHFYFFLYSVYCPVFNPTLPPLSHPRLMQNEKNYFLRIVRRLFNIILTPLHWKEVFFLFLVCFFLVISKLGLPKLWVSEVFMPEVPRWTLSENRVCQWENVVKGSVPTGALRSVFLKHLVNQHQYPVRMYTDGSRSDARIGCTVHAE